MNNIICLDDKYSTTRLILCDENSGEGSNKALHSAVIASKIKQSFNSKLFIPESDGRKGEGGLRTKGYFKKSFEDKPLITIVTVVYNGEKYLEETILSVIAQTYHNVEYIIIDGSSTDGTLDIIKKYEDRIDYWVSEKDEGMYDAINKGFSVSTGDLLNFCNSDDVLHNNSVLAAISSDYLKLDFDSCYGRTEYIDSKGNIVDKRFPVAFKQRYLVTLGMPFAQPTFFWKRTLMQEVGKLELQYKIVSDYHFIGRLLLKSKKIHSMEKTVVKFRWHGNSFGDKNHKLALHEAKIIRSYFAKELNMNTFFVITFSIYDRLFQKLNYLLKKYIEKFLMKNFI